MYHVAYHRDELKLIITVNGIVRLHDRGYRKAAEVRTRVVLNRPGGLASLPAAATWERLRYFTTHCIRALVAKRPLKQTNTY